MGNTTKISWCDSSANFWSGCTKVSEGCKNCYAEALSKNKFFGGGKTIGKWGKGAPRQLHESAFKLALRLNKRPWVCPVCGHGMTEDESKGYVGCPNQAAQKEWLESDRLSPLPPVRVMHVTQHHRRRIFSLSLGDWLDEEVPIEWLARMLDTIRQCDQVTWILCSKRPENFHPRMREVVTAQTTYSDLAVWIRGWTGISIPKNIILLTSVENQAMLDKRYKDSAAIPSACRGFSFEPLLAEINVPDWSGISWAIIGSESGKHRRFQDGYPAAALSLIRQARAAGLKVFHKQMPIHGRVSTNPADWPPDFQIRQHPVL
jgi:protein gp37